MALWVRLRVHTVLFQLPLTHIVHSQVLDSSQPPLLIWGVILLLVLLCATGFMQSLVRGYCLACGTKWCQALIPQLHLESNQSALVDTKAMWLVVSFQRKSSIIHPSSVKNASLTKLVHHVTCIVIFFVHCRTMSSVQSQVQQDWSNREFVEVITSSITKISEFLNAFDLSARSRLAVLNQKLTAMERQVEYIEAQVSKIWWLWFVRF